VTFCFIEASTEIECLFRTAASPIRYVCDISGVVVDKTSQEVVISGQHFPGMTNDDVGFVNVSDSTIGFVMPQIFTTFPNAIRVDLKNIGLTEIPLRESFKLARVELMEIMFNPRLTSIHSNAFPGGAHLRELTLSRNAIAHIHENAFVGLNRLQFLFIIGNRIHTLPLQLFRPLPILEWVYASENQLTTIFGQQFLHNPLLRTLAISNNRINAIERNFMEPTPRISVVNLIGNLCIDFAFVFHITRNQSIIDNLAPCYDNFDLL
jgi:Leucine-rich repeat (LRR) protein